MTGHVLKRGSRWAFKFDIGRDPTTGKRKTKWVSGFATKKAAEAELAKVLHELQTGSYVEPTRLTVAQMLRKWLAEYAAPRVSGKTYERYEEIVEKSLIPYVGSHLLAKLQPLHIQAVYNLQLDRGRRNGKGPLSPQTVLHHHRVLRKALAQAVRWNLLAANPADRVDPPSVRQKEIKAVDEVQALWLIEVSQGTRLYIPIMLALYTGMRRGEVLALRWSDVDFDNGHARVSRAMEYTRKAGCVFKEPKSRNSRRIISLPQSLIAALERHRSQQAEYREALGVAYQKNDLVCCVEDGSLWGPPAFESAYRALLKRRNLQGPTFHGLRHSHASQLLKAGVDMKVISERLGHSRASFTIDQYIHVLPGMRDRAASAIEAAYNAAREKVGLDREQ